MTLALIAYHSLTILLGIVFVLAGYNHFRDPGFYLKIMPPFIPWHKAMVAISGVAEILGGLGILLPQTRYWAGWGLMALLVAVFPANIYSALEGINPVNSKAPGWILWVRLPFQAVFMLWVWWVALRPDISH